MKLDPDLVYALALDQYGLAVTDPRGYNYDNPRVYTKDQNNTVAPRLLIQFAPERDTQPPGEVESLEVEPGPLDGEIIVSFTAPEDPQAETAFGYRVRVSESADFESAEDIAQWRIPRPAKPGARQKILIEELTQGSAQHVFIRAYDRAGNEGSTKIATFTVPAARPVSTLPDGAFSIPDSSGAAISTVEGIMRYWACSEVTKVNPVTGNRIEDGYARRGSDEYKKTNAVWDAGSNTISLSACRNEMVGFQLVLERTVDTLTNVQIAVSDLKKGPDNAVIPSYPYVEAFLAHYVKANTTWYPDAAIPLTPPFPTVFSIPDRDHNPSGVNQSIWFDIYTPKTARTGLYFGKIKVNANELSAPVLILLTLQVSPIEIPDELSFIIDLNGYGNKWDYGNADQTRLKWFQACQKHRMSLNTLPYGWSASVTSDRAPTLTGEGSGQRIDDWSTFDDHYGSLFDGSAFSPDTPGSPYTGPGMNTPVSTFYTTFFESWPIHVLDANYGFDAGGRGGRVLESIDRLEFKRVLDRRARRAYVVYRRVQARRTQCREGMVRARRSERMEPDVLSDLLES